MSKKQRNGQAKSGHRSSSSSFISVNQIILAAIAGILFYLSIDSRLSDRTKELILFESFDGPFKENNDLFDVDKIFTDQLPGPESLASYKGDLYTGTKDGRIVRIHGSNKLSTVISLGPDSCLAKVNIKACGRPLGVRVTSSGDLYTVDAFNGLVKVTNIDGTSGKPESKILYDINLPVDGNASVFLDDLVVDDRSPEDRVIYMTDASNLWDLHDCVAAIMDLDDSGRILRYTESSGLVDVVLKGLAFPNGIELTDSRDALLIAEFTNRRILKHYLNGPAKGTTEVLIDLPGEPDNIRRSSRSDRETYWIAVFSPRTKANQSPIDYYAERPHLRAFMITIYQLYGTLIEMIGDTFGSKSLKVHGKAKSSLWSFIETAGRSMALEIDSNGNVINCLHSNGGYIHSISEIYDEINKNGQRNLYLGSFSNNYLGVLPLNQP